MGEILIHLIFVITFTSVVYGFSVPKVNVKLLKPKGIQFSLKEKDESAVSTARIFIFTSRGLINDLQYVESELTKDDSGLWIYETSNTAFTSDDTIEYWMYVEHENFGYYTSQTVKIEDIEYASEREKRMLAIERKITHPKVNVQMMKPEGLRFSVDDSSFAYDAIRIILFSPKNEIIKNQKFIENDLRRDDSGLWIYEMQNISLKLNDVIEYWIYAEHSNVGFFDSKVFRVQDLDFDNDVEVEKHVEDACIPPNNTYPNVDVQIEGNMTIQFSIQEENIVYTTINILLFSPKNAINNNQKFIENEMSRDDNGLWFYEVQTNNPLKYNDIIEYWISAESQNVGFFSNGMFKVQDIAPSLYEQQTTEKSQEATTSTPQPISPSTTEIPIINCEVSVSTVNGKSVGCKNSIIFNEDFNSDNLKYWNFDTRYPLDDAVSDAEFVVYEKRPETSYIRDNMLTLKAESLKRLLGFDDVRIRVGSYNLKERCTPLTNDVELECERQARFGYILPPVTSAYLTTRNKFSFKYGNVVARVRGPVGDWLYGQMTLQPQFESGDTPTISSQHLKVFFTRGNENLKDNGEEVGGRTVYGGAILSKNPKNNHKWLKNKNFPNSHLGNDFHIYELLWTPKEISLSIDGIKYGSLNTNLRDSAITAKIKSAINWTNNGPFDKEHFISINLAAGSVKNFYSYNATLLNGASLEPKPWNDTDPKALLSFYLAHDKWHQTWKRPSLDVDYIKIYSV